MIRTDSKSNKDPQNYVIKDAETDIVLVRLVPAPFDEPGQFEIMKGSEGDTFLGTISNSWLELEGGLDNPLKDMYGLKIAKGIHVDIKGYLIGALFNMVMYHSFVELINPE